MLEFEVIVLSKEIKLGSSVLSNVAPQGVSPAIKFREAERMKHRDIRLLTVQFSHNSGVIKF